MDTHRYRQAEDALFATAGVDPEERWIALPTLGVKARVLEVGTGRPAVFLHGGPNAAATWAHLAAATEGVRCLLVDRPGCGLSEPLPATPDASSLPRYVETLTADVLDGLGLDGADLVGSSFGGYVALRGAAAHPGRVGRVVLAGCPAFVPGWRAPGFFSLLRTPVVGRLLLSLPPTAGAVRTSLRQMGHGRSLAGGRIPAPMLDWVRAWQRDTGTMANDAAMIVACGTRRRGFDPALDLDDAALAAVTAPTLVVAGTDDPVGGEAVCRDLARRLPDARVEVLAGAGHLPWLDDPDGVAGLVSSFLAG